MLLCRTTTSTVWLRNWKTSTTPMTPTRKPIFGLTTAERRTLPHEGRTRWYGSRRENGWWLAWSLTEDKRFSMTHSSVWRKAARVEQSAFAALPPAPSLGKPGGLVGYQVRSSEVLVRSVGLSDERQGLFGMRDVGVDGAAVDAEVTGCLSHRVGFFGRDIALSSEKSMCIYLQKRICRVKLQLFYQPWNTLNIRQDMILCDFVG